MERPETSRRDFLCKTAPVFFVPFTSSVVEVRAEAEDILNRSLTKKNQIPVISIVADGGISQRESFDPKKNPLSQYDFGFECYAPSNESDVLLSELFTRMRTVMNTVAVCRTVQSPGIQGFHKDDSRSLLVNEEGVNWHEKIAQMDDGGFPYFYSPAPHASLGIKTNEQGVGLRRENHPFHSIKNAYRFHPSKVDSYAARKRTAALLEREDLLLQLDTQCIAGRHIDDYMRNRRMAMNLLTNQTANLMDRPDSHVIKRYGEYGLSLYYASQLIKNGFPCIAVRVGSWDFHFGLETSMKAYAPQLDKALAALITDVNTGDIPECIISFCSEFGRKPGIRRGSSRPPGRDHWSTTTALLHGPTVEPGVYGITDSCSRPVSDVYQIQSSDWLRLVAAAAKCPVDISKVPLAKHVLKTVS